MKLLTSSTIYLISTCFSRATPFILLPILTSYFSPEEFGIASLIIVSISFSNALVGMNMQAVISREYSTASIDKMGNIIKNIYVILFFSASLYSLLIWIIEGRINVPFDSRFLFVFPVLTLFSSMNLITLTVIRNQQKPKLYAMMEIITSTLIIALTVYFVAKTDFGLYSQGIAMLCSYIVMAVISIWYLNRIGMLSTSKYIPEFNGILKTSLPFIPHVLASSTIAVSDRFFIEYYIDSSTVGVYSIGYSFGMILVIFVDSFIKAWSPWFYRVIKDSSTVVKRRIVTYTYYFLAFMVIMALVLTGVSKVIISLFLDEAFFSASEFVFWISIGCVCQGVYKILFPYFIFCDKTKVIAFSTIISAAINLILNMLLIPLFGAVGAAYATLASYLCCACVMVLYQHRIIPMPWLRVFTTTTR